MKLRLTAVATVLLLAALTATAIAHAVGYSIPGYGRWGPSAYHCAYHQVSGALLWCYPSRAEVEQFDSSGFWWRWTEVGPGTNYGGVGLYGDLYIIRSDNGQNLYYSSSFFCDPVNTWNAIGFSAWSVPPGSYWHQYSASDCYSTSPFSDALQVWPAP